MVVDTSESCCRLESGVAEAFLRCTKPLWNVYDLIGPVVRAAPSSIEDCMTLQHTFALTLWIVGKILFTLHDLPRPRLLIHAPPLQGHLLGGIALILSCL